MKKGIKPKSGLKVTGIDQYIKNRRIIKETPFIFSSSEKGYFFEGKVIDEKCFLKMFEPVLIPINYKGENPDGTKIK